MSTPKTEGSALQVFEWKGEGYAPLVFSHDWMAAILNWEPAVEPDTIHEVERHNRSDEVFVLLRGKAALVIVEDGGVQVVEAVPGTIYKVTKGSWHTVIGDKESSWIIVENRDTHLHDTEMRPLTEIEMASYCEASFELFAS